jgi:catechol 2,3-dioxygenase-like lactoylglutathione lyase family enzyme
MQFNPLIPELIVSNIDASLEFYVGQLGFTVKYDRPEKRFAFIEKEGSQLMLDELAENSWLTKRPIEKPFGQGINFEIGINDVDELYNNLRSNGYKFFLDIEDKHYQCGEELSGQRQFIIEDPDGYLLRFCSDIKA